MPNYRMRMAGSKTAEVFLYDEIGSGFFDSSVSAKQFADDLKAMGKVDRINVRVNSPGGDVFDGLAIYNTLKRHPAYVAMDIDGMALSIASIIVMAGDEINMAKNAMMMIHDPWKVAGGTADDFRKLADMMDQVKGNMAKTYSDRTKMPENEIEDMMSAETWMTAEQAVKNGFADLVTEELQMVARFDLSRFNKAPKGLAHAARQRAGADLFRGKIAANARRMKELTGQ